MHTVLQAVNKGFAFVCTTQVITEVEYCIIVIQGQGVQKFLQLLESVANLLWVAFVGLSIGLVNLIQNRLSVTIAGVEWVCLDTAQKMKAFRLVAWDLHGICGAGKTMDRTFGLIGTVEKAAQIYMLAVIILE